MEAQVPEKPLLSTAFGREEIAVLRQLVLVLAADAGVVDGRRQDLVLAIHELTTNVVRHGGGSGRLDLWLDGGRMRFAVTDHGPGLTAEVPELPPAPTAVGGRGLWIARQVLDELSVRTGPGGTQILGSVSINGERTPPHAPARAARVKPGQAGDRLPEHDGARRA